MFNSTIVCSSSHHGVKQRKTAAQTNWECVYAHITPACLRVCVCGRVCIATRAFQPPKRATETLRGRVNKAVFGDRRIWRGTTGTPAD